jgi:hypothetical protein
MMVVDWLLKHEAPEAIYYTRHSTGNCCGERRALLLCLEVELMARGRVLNFVPRVD